MNLELQLQRAVRRFAEHDAVLDGEVRLTYAQFHDRALRLGDALLGLGLAPGGTTQIQHLLIARDVLGIDAIR